MEVVKISPRGYCHGVVTALNTVSKTINDDTLPKPIYILGEIVHNNNITKAYAEAGIQTLTGPTRREILNNVTTGTIIITAHGIDPNLIQLAKSKNLHVIDATCSDVYRTHDVIKERANDGFNIIYIGKKGHPEPEGAVGVAPDKVYLIETLADVDELNINNEKLCVTNQTTMSMWDVVKIVEKLKMKYPQIEVINEICGATRERQEAVAQMDENIDLLLVVGDINSNNTNRLTEVSETIKKIPSYRIANVSDINIESLKDINKVAVTSGASTPTIITSEVIKFLEQFDANDPNTWNNETQIPLNRMIPKAKK